jgi:hypothetical protein
MTHRLTPAEWERQKKVMIVKNTVVAAPDAATLLQTMQIG